MHRWKFRQVHNTGGVDAATAITLRKIELLTEIRYGVLTLDGLRARVDQIKYGDTTTHFEPLPTDIAQDAPHLSSDTKLMDRIQAIYDNRQVPIVQGAATPSNMEYEFHVNPNDGGSPVVQKQMNISSNAGPNRGAILQEGQSSPPELSWSGVILSQQHLEALEEWYDRRVLIELKDDLGRTFQGVFTGFSPQRVRKASNFWYHTYSATFTVYGYRNAVGKIRYGRF